ncbi:universal stress protein UspA-like protein [Halovivax ruber XH-70]|uniref:Universal stress protein UspA-like protein n=1 Tax=Halovivax ruber (strain DSM 18193 / JCM 13892 / XH-70) TaxID=797302 RepID=L0ICX0_HALRX|nr:universal stress protein [Halovivax ruber]AGB16683.1 universal stress protein UspA-like protein [Halovivax ruber XH-70]
MHFRHLLVPVASEADADVTCHALSGYLDDVERVTAVHVIEKAGGGIDKAPLGKREEDSEDILDDVETTLGDRVQVDTDRYYGTDVAETIFEAAADVDADAVAFRARGGSRIARLLAGDVSTRIVTDPSIPVVSLPKPAE